MSTWRTYVKPFYDDSGTSYASSWTEVTKDVAAMSGLTMQLDNTEFDTGILRASNMKLGLQNEHGHYNDVGQVESIFKYKRSDTKVKFTWEPGDHPLTASFFNAGSGDAILSEEVDVFEGLLSDVATQADIDAPTVEFQVLGYEGKLSETLVPYSSITNGDSIATAIYTILNQAPFNTLVTVAQANITTGETATIDTKASLENKTSLEAVKVLLQASNSVLYIVNNVVYVGPRTATSDLRFSFYGTGSVSGGENIVDIQAYRSGLNRIRNFWTWKDTTLSKQNSSSITQYGYQKKEISLDVITDNTKRNTLLQSLMTEFSDKQREMNLTSFITPDLLTVDLLDRVKVDYPSPSIPHENELVALYGVGEYNVNYYADSLYPIEILSTARFKVMSKKIDFQKEVITFGLREISA